MKYLTYVLLAAFLCVLLIGVVALPPRGDASAPAHRAVTDAFTPVAGTYYIQHAYKDARTPNMVTVILGDYRSFDTLGETIVVLTGGIACFFILSFRRRRP